MFLGGSLGRVKGVSNWLFCYGLTLVRLADRHSVNNREGAGPAVLGILFVLIRLDQGRNDIDPRR